MSDPRSPLILAVDDDEEILDLIAFRLRKAGYRTLTARDGLGALRVLGEDKPDLVLLDVDMPNLDGMAVCRIVQASDADAPAIIFVSASTSVSARVRGLELGAVDYVTKPFSSTELLARVEVALRLRDQRRASAA